MRKEVVASGLSSAFNARANKAGLSFVNYTDWYEGLMRNKESRNALFMNLDKDARKKLQDLYRVSRGVRNSRKEYIPTGKTESVIKNIENIDSVANKIYGLAMGSVPFEVVATSAGVPGAGLVAGSLRNLGKSKQSVVKLADDLMTSPEFIKLASEGTEEAARKVTKLDKFKKFIRKIGKDFNEEDFIIGAFQTGRTIGQSGIKE